MQPATQKQAAGPWAHRRGPALPQGARGRWLFGPLRENRRLPARLEGEADGHGCL